MANSELEPANRSCLSCRTRAGSIFCDLSCSPLAELDRMRQTSVYPGGVVLFMEGEEPRGVYCVGSGRVKLSTSDASGRTAIVHIATAGDLFGVRAALAGQPHDLTAETLERTELCFFRKDDFLGFLSRHGAVSLRLAQHLSDKLYEAYREVREVALKQSSERLAQLLLRLCQTQGEPAPEGIRLKLNLSQEELAELIGASRRTLTRALHKLRQRGVIECRRRSIIVRDRLELERLLPPENLF